MDDFSEFWLDTLDDSSLLYPHMLQDISLTGMTGINEQLNSDLNAMNLNAMNSGDNLSISSGAQNTTGNANTMWNDIGNTKPFQIDDDRIFQNKKFDPTLAQLNTESLHEDLNVGDWPFEEGSYLTSILLQTNLQQKQSLNHINDEQNNTGSSNPYEVYHSTPTKSFNSSSAITPARQASTNLTIPPRDSNRSQNQQDMASDSGRTKTPFLQKLSKKEYSMSQNRNVQCRPVPGPSTSHILMNSKISSGSTSRPSSSVPTEFRLATKGRKEQYFLQHNVQAKGPKRQRLVVSNIPHNVRKMPKKDRKIITCRDYPARQTAHHEVNQIKLHESEMERKGLLTGINNIKHIIAHRSQNSTDNTVDASQEIEKIFEVSTKLQIAGQTAALVKKVLENQKAGVPNGDLEDTKSI